MERIILHCDMNSFYASVELLSHPELANAPVAVSGNPENRHGIILAKNETAKRFGIVTAETVQQALKKCPDLVLLPPHHEKYREYSKRINHIYQQYTDMVEPFSVDESWLDVTASQRLFGDGSTIADRIRNQVKQELGLTLSVGVSYNKIFAKMGSDYKKPDATTVITRDNYQELLWPMPVNAMFFVGFATAQRLNDIGILTIGDLALASPNRLEQVLGKQGPLLRTYARGEDQSPVKLTGERDRIKSIGNGITFRRNLLSREDIQTALVSLSDTVAGRLRKHDLKCYGVKVDIKDPDFKTISRQRQLTQPTNLAEEIRHTGMKLIEDSWTIGKPIRLITLTAINLTDGSDGEQLSLFTDYSEGGGDGTHKKTESMERTMDSIRDRFGNQAIQFGATLHNDIGVDV